MGREVSGRRCHQKPILWLGVISSTLSCEVLGTGFVWSRKRRARSWSCTSRNPALARGGQPSVYTVWGWRVKAPVFAKSVCFNQSQTVQTREGDPPALNTHSASDRKAFVLLTQAPGVAQRG